MDKKSHHDQVKHVLNKTETKPRTHLPISLRFESHDFDINGCRSVRIFLNTYQAEKKKKKNPLSDLLTLF